MSVPIHLSPPSAAILRAVIAAIRPRGHGFDQPIDEDVLLEIDRTLPFFPPLMRRAFPIGLHALEWAPLLVAGRATRLTRMRREEAERYLDGWLRSRLAPRRMLALGVRTLIYLAIFQHPTILQAMEVRWGDRVPETVRLRAASLARVAR
jgi:hypothetical protein